MTARTWFSRTALLLALAGSLAIAQNANAAAHTVDAHPGAMAHGQNDIANLTAQGPHGYGKYRGYRKGLRFQRGFRGGFHRGHRGFHRGIRGFRSSPRFYRGRSFGPRFRGGFGRRGFGFRRYC